MYREVTMNEIKEVLRLWLAGMPKKRIAAQLSLDPKTVRRYVAVAGTSGLAVAQGPGALTDERVTEVLLALHPTRGRPHGASWATCVAQHAFLEKLLAQGLRLTKIRRLLKRRRIDVVSHAASLRGRASGIWPDGADGAGRRRRAWSRGATRHGLGRPAARPDGQDATLQGVDLHRRRLPPSVRVPDLTRDDRRGDRGV
jgi:hypothetical protein